MYNFLRTLALFSCAATATATGSLPADRQFTRHDLYQVLLGVLEGGLEHEIALVQTCVTDAAGTLGKVDMAIADLEHWDDEDSVKQGIELLGEALHEAVEVDLQACALADKDLQKLTLAAQTLAHPLSFLYHAGRNIIINHVEVAEEVHTAIADWRNSPPEYYDFGRNVGEVMRLVLVGTQAMDQQKLRGNTVVVESV